MNMKSLLFFIAASLMTVSAGAQLKGVDGFAPRQPMSLSRVQPQVEVMEMQARKPGEAVPSPRRSPAPIKPYYLRPAGAFYSPFIAENGCGFYSLGGLEFMLVKPYKDYTYYSVVNGADENDEWFWNYSFEDTTRNLTANYDIELCDPPHLVVYHSDIDYYESFQYPRYPRDEPFGMNDNKTFIYSAPNSSYLFDDEDECELLLSSKTMCAGGRNGDMNGSYYLVYDGPVPFDGNDRGWWFGKNGSHINGMAQAFEKPTHPYLLKKICVQTMFLACTAPVQLCCKVYRLDEIPAYRDDESVELSAQFGDPIAIGYSLVTPETNDLCNGLVEFTLIGFDEDDPDLVYDTTHTIDYPILVVIEDYNNPECDALRDFTCFISNDIHVDEGYGELAYLKCPVNDEEGNFTGEYVWKGLNNFFRTGEMKTGFSIFIVADQPYVAFYYDDDGEYCFPAEGGGFEKVFEYPDTTIVCSGIEFLSSNPSEEWEITWIGSNDLSDWLEFELEDEIDDTGEFTGIVLAHVTAARMHSSLYDYYRGATIRFSIPGDYIDYRFQQVFYAGDALEEQFVNGDAVPVGYYDITGRQLSGLQQGINIVMMSDGTAIKVFKK